MGLSLHYEQNLVALIKQLRVQYNAPKAKVDLASLFCACGTCHDKLFLTMACGTVCYGIARADCDG